MNELTLLNESVVLPEEIDSLGHMNVRYYMTRAARANEELLKQAGYWQGNESAEFVRRIDTYTRFRQEQFADARLHTVGGLVANETPETDKVSGYFEIRNPDTNAIAATFIFTSSIVDRHSLQPVTITPVAQDNSLWAPVPDHGLPRTVSLSTPKAVDLETLDKLVGNEPTPGMMSGKREGEVLASDCDELGNLKEETDVMFVLHRPQPGENLSNYGPPVLHDEQGRRYSWAVMETRNLTLSRPRVGDHIVSIGADLDHGEKWRWSRRWMFTQQTGEMLGVSDTVAICIDLDARRAIPVPQDVRDSMAKQDLRELT